MESRKNKLLHAESLALMIDESWIPYGTIIPRNAPVESEPNKSPPTVIGGYLDS